MGGSSDRDVAVVSDSVFTRQLVSGSRWSRFEPAVERKFLASSLLSARGRVRTWHTAILAVLVFLVLPGIVSAQFGGALGYTWNGAHGDLLLVIAAVNTVCRAVLAIVAWIPSYERLYPRIAFPLVVTTHASWAFVCSGEILGAHPEYLAAVVADAYATYFFTGLPFRRALPVSVFAVAAFLLGGWYFSGTPAPITFFAIHLLINTVMAATAGASFERSARDLFVEHSLLRETAALDGLTGLRNRRAFDEHVDRVWQQAVRDGRLLGILMIDVDEFKHYNDQYGHQAGDAALRRIAAIIKRSGKRPLDLAARYGGEELAVILYDLPSQRVTGIAEELRGAVEELSIEHRESTGGVVTVSIGTAIVAPKPGRSSQGALQLADEALYRAKRQGRNRVVVLEREYETSSTGSFPRFASSDA